MLLAIDVGNTQSVFALCEDGGVRHSWRMSTDAHRTGDEYAALLLGLMQRAGLEASSVRATILSSVVPDAVFPLRRCCETYFGASPYVVGKDASRDGGGALPMEVLIDQPEELGADRLVNAYEAWERWRRPLIVIDFGTATTFDVVNAKGQYAGGVIAPGVNLSLEALSRAAARLHGIRIRRPQRAIGTNTTHAMQSGIYYGYLGLIRGILGELRAEGGEDFYVVATGGLAGLYARDNPDIDVVDEELTVRGLLRMYEHSK